MKMPHYPSSASLGTRYVRAFTLIELLIVIAVVGILSSMLLPALTRGKDSARRVQCASNLHQLGIAAELYWNDNEGVCFTARTMATNGGVLHWCGWLESGKPEGQRRYDFADSKLFPYVSSSDARLCPSLNSWTAQFKLKATNLVLCAYGYNSIALSPPVVSSPPVKIDQIRHFADVALFADAIQINDFQAPASPAHPMLEEWYYLDNPTNRPGPGYYPHGHFRHSQRANVVFCDGHVGVEKFLPGSIDLKLPNQFVARYRPEILIP
jgi:prepilin-type N-terminal cleavage/methylation domain-containing protein/prepilin-type processing-associated H-X9-DG protein